MSDQRRYNPEVTSIANERVRFVKGLYSKAQLRREERLYVVEGVRLVEEALLARLNPEFVLVAPERLESTPRGQALLARLSEYPTVRVSEAVLKSVSDTVAPQGVIAVLRMPEPPKNPSFGPLALILDRVRDPGNAGTLLRSADAGGITRTVAFVDSVDAYSPKVVRAGMGAHFRLAILDDISWATLLPLLGSRHSYLAVADGGLAYDQVNWTRDAALIVGGEAEGAGPIAEQYATHRVTIPMSGPVESLNAAMAGTIILFEAASQRREARSGYELAPGEPRVLPQQRPAIVHQPAQKNPLPPPPRVPRSSRPPMEPRPPMEAGPPPRSRDARPPRPPVEAGPPPRSRDARPPRPLVEAGPPPPRSPRNATDRFSRPPSTGEPSGKTRGPRPPGGKPFGKPPGKPGESPYRPPGGSKPYRAPTGKSFGKPKGKPFSGKPPAATGPERPPRRSGGKPHRPKL